MSKIILSGIVGLVCLLSGCRKAVNVETNHIPLFHFTTVMNWTGEPAGLVYDDELYHLFYNIILLEMYLGIYIGDML